MIFTITKLKTTKNINLRYFFLLLRFYIWYCELRKCVCHHWLSMACECARARPSDAVWSAYIHNFWVSTIVALLSSSSTSLLYIDVQKILQSIAQTTFDIHTYRTNTGYKWYSNHWTYYYVHKMVRQIRFRACMIMHSKCQFVLCFHKYHWHLCQFSCHYLHWYCSGATFCE